ncbi:hypothetical protein P4S72_13230 [Vibrio sp. PP-XX7]
MYSQRMQIEEAFRDHKSSQYGMGLETNRTESRSRLSILVLIGTLAHNLLILIGVMTENLGIHRRFQANTIRERKVLSYFSLGRRFYRTNTIGISSSAWKAAIMTLRQKIESAQVVLE